MTRLATNTVYSTTNILSIIDANVCSIAIPISTNSHHYVRLVALPTVSDSKTAMYNQETVIGRSYPMYTYSNSGDRTIQIQLHFYITRTPCVSSGAAVGASEGKNGGFGCCQCALCNVQNLRALQSALYPRDAPPIFMPPPICKIMMGGLLASTPLCGILTSCNVSFPTDVPWDEYNFCPYRFDVDTSWNIVYSSSDLPYASRIYYISR